MGAEKMGWTDYQGKLARGEMEMITATSLTKSEIRMTKSEIMRKQRESFMPAIMKHHAVEVRFCSAIYWR